VAEAVVAVVETTVAAVRTAIMDATKAYPNKQGQPVGTSTQPTTAPASSISSTPPPFPNDLQY
jgi:hypothetical protein